jgi:hypothetical protein
MYIDQPSNASKEMVNPKARAKNFEFVQTPLLLRLLEVSVISQVLSALPTDHLAS